MWVIGKPKPPHIAMVAYKCCICKSQSDWCVLHKDQGMVGIAYDAGNVDNAIRILIEEMAPKMFAEIGWRRNGNDVTCPQCSKLH
jgi:hypothetical protein